MLINALPSCFQVASVDQNQLEILHLVWIEQIMVGTLDSLDNLRAVRLPSPQLRRDVCARDSDSPVPKGTPTGRGSSNYVGLPEVKVYGIGVPRIERQSE